MSEPSTIDEMIVALEKLKSRIGGDTKVVFQDYMAGTLRSPIISISAIAKNDKNKLVSRGGVRCVLVY